MDRQDIENELRAPGARELLASTSATHLAWARYYDFHAGRMPRFLQDLAERNPS